MKGVSAVDDWISSRTKSSDHLAGRKCLHQCQKCSQHARKRRVSASMRTWWTTSSVTGTSRAASAINSIMCFISTSAGPAKELLQITIRKNGPPNDLLHLNVATSSPKENHMRRGAELEDFKVAPMKVSGDANPPHHDKSCPARANILKACHEDSQGGSVEDCWSSGSLGHRAKSVTRSIDHLLVIFVNRLPTVPHVQHELLDEEIDLLDSIYCTLVVRHIKMFKLLSTLILRWAPRCGTAHHGVVIAHRELRSTSRLHITAAMQGRSHGSLDGQLFVSPPRT